MKATEANLLAFIKKSPQFMIPIYQRTYSQQFSLWKFRLDIAVTIENNCNSNPCKAYVFVDTLMAWTDQKP